MRTVVLQLKARIVVVLKTGDLLRKCVLILFFLLQVVGVVMGLGSSSKFFAWVPYDELTTYQIHVEIEGRVLSTEEVQQRYLLQNPGRENRSIDHLFSILTQYERTYGKEQNARVEVSYSVNGRESQNWLLTK
ncbi:hypothetical protein [Algoriphagus namhaensis]